MAALSDPRAFLSAQEKRNDQLKQMGIEETDIQNIPGVPASGGGGAKNEKKGSKTKKGIEEVKGGTNLTSKYLYLNDGHRI